MIGEDMTLDAATANSLLVPSDDPREVHCGAFRHHPREDPQRFASMACVLGTPCFSSGPHYWEVDVEEGKEWAPGLCQEPVDRRRKSGSSERGFWVISVKAGAIHSSGIRRPGSRKPWPQPERLFLDVHTEGIRFLMFEMMPSSTCTVISFGNLCVRFSVLSCLEKRTVGPLSICW